MVSSLASVPHFCTPLETPFPSNTPLEIPSPANASDRVLVSDTNFEELLAVVIITLLVIVVVCVDVPTTVVAGEYNRLAVPSFSSLRLGGFSRPPKM